MVSRVGLVFAAIVCCALPACAVGVPALDPGADDDGLGGASGAADAGAGDGSVPRDRFKPGGEEDFCPDDPAKFQPGPCGCGNVEVDSDGDGVFDCRDACPDDPSTDSEREWYPDCDGDGEPADAAVAACAPEDLEGRSPCDGGAEPSGGWSSRAGLDCDDGDAAAIEGFPMYPDCDGDGAHAGLSDIVCDGVPVEQAAPCDDGEPPDGGFSAAGGDDCDDENAAASAETDWYPDCDADGEPTEWSTRACGEPGDDAVLGCLSGLPPAGGWLSAPGVDCDDADGDNPCDCGLQDNEGDGQCDPVSSLEDAEDLPTGVADFELAGGTLPVYVDADFEGGGWVLIGRGREGWAWSDGGRGNAQTVVSGLGTPGAFGPAYLSTQSIQALLDAADSDLRQVEVRIRRAADAGGAAYQEGIWTVLSRSRWTWLFDTDAHDVTFDVRGSVLGAGGSSVGTTRDVGGADYQRVFTWSWEGHGGLRGFSYGETVPGGSNEPASYLWQLADEGHPVPYTEIYLRTRPPAPPPPPRSCAEVQAAEPDANSGTYLIDPDGDGPIEPFSVECDMETDGGGWTVMYDEDFASGSASGWTDQEGAPARVDRTSDCAAAYSAMLGGYGHFAVGSEARRSFDLLGIPHTEAAVELQYVVIDSWDAEQAEVYVDDLAEPSFSATFQHKEAPGPVCGTARWNDTGPVPVAFSVDHAANALSLRVTSTLGGAPTDESFGVDDVRLRIR